MPIYPEGFAFFPPFLEGHGRGAFVCDKDPALTVRSRDLNRAGLEGFRFLLDSIAMSGLRVGDVTDSEAPAARDEDGAAPLVTSEGRWAATLNLGWNLKRASLSSRRLSSASGYVMLLAPSLVQVSGIKDPEAESQLVKQLQVQVLYSGIVKVLGFT